MSPDPNLALIALIPLLLLGAACSGKHASPTAVATSVLASASVTVDVGSTAYSATATSGAESRTAAVSTGIAQTGASPTPLPAYPCEASATCICHDFPSRPEAGRIYAKHGGNGWSGLSPNAYGVVCDQLP